MGTEASKATKAAGEVLRAMDPDKLIDELEEWVRWRARMLLCGLALVGYGRARVIDGYRTLDGCRKLYGFGRGEDECEEAGVSRTRAQPQEEKVTWVVPEFSMHHRRRALDIDLSMYTGLNVDAVDRVARAVGMTYGGVWSVRDTYHFEV